MLLYLAALGLAGTSSQTCGLTRVERCDAMWELVERQDFKRELRRFLGRGKESWTVPDTDRFEQVIRTLSVSSEAPVKLDDGIVRLGGCFPHNCPERAQVFFAPAGEIKAVALLYHDCGGKACSGDENFTLRILVRQRSSRLEEHARHWAESELKRDADKFPQFGADKLAGTIVQLIRD